MNYPILMADIIDSRKKNSQDLIFQFKSLVKKTNQLFKPELISPLTITLGDEFQGVANSIESLIELIFKMEELIVQNEYRFKLRYVLYYGTIATEINPKNAYEMLGDGLTNARKILNESKAEESRITIRLNQKKKLKEEYLNKSFFIYQNYVDNWKVKDLKAVISFLIYDDYKIVSNKINVNRSSAWRRKKSLNIVEYKNIKDIIRFLVKT